MKNVILTFCMILFWATHSQAQPDSLLVMEAAVKAAPKDGYAWVKLGNAYLDIGEVKKADNAFRKGIRSA